MASNRIYHFMAVVYYAVVLPRSWSYLDYARTYRRQSQQVQSQPHHDVPR